QTARGREVGDEHAPAGHGWSAVAGPNRRAPENLKSLVGKALQNPCLGPDAETVLSTELRPVVRSSANRADTKESEQPGDGGPHRQAWVSDDPLRQLSTRVFCRFLPSYQPAFMKNDGSHGEGARSSVTLLFDVDPDVLSDRRGNRQLFAVLRQLPGSLKRG